MLIENMFTHLIKSPKFFRLVFPHIKTEYLDSKEDKLLFTTIKKYYDDYNKLPQFSELKLLFEANNDISIEDTELMYTRLEELKSTEEITDEELLIHEVERFVQDKAIEKAILESADLLLKKGTNRGKIEEMIKEALAIEFDVKIGDDYFKDVKKRMEEYFETEDKIPLDNQALNIALGGGLVKKAIFFFMSPTGTGKSAFLAHCTTSLTKSGHNILYLTGELSCKEVQKRLDANLLDIPINSLNQTLDKKIFKSKIKELLSKSHGELLVKYCPAGSTNAIHIKNTINEIKLKKNFIPDIIVIDHLTLFASSRLPSNQAGSHLYVRATVEEIRSIAIEYNCVVLTACQLNRGGKAKKNDVNNEDVALGYAISETSDWSSAIIQTPELKEQKKFLLKVMKSRFGSNTEKIYSIGIDYEHMRLSDVEGDCEDIPIHVKDKIKGQQILNEQETNVFDFS